MNLLPIASTQSHWTRCEVSNSRMSGAPSLLSACSYFWLIRSHQSRLHRTCTLCLSVSNFSPLWSCISDRTSCHWELTSQDPVCNTAGEPHSCIGRRAQSHLSSQLMFLSSRCRIYFDYSRLLPICCSLEFASRSCFGHHSGRRIGSVAIRDLSSWSADFLGIARNSILVGPMSFNLARSSPIWKRIMSFLILISLKKKKFIT